MGNLTGVPIRLYEKGELTFSLSVSSLPRDPICVYADDIMKIGEHVGYYVTKRFFYYGIVNSGDTKIVIGPTRQMVPEEQELKELAFEMNLPGDDLEEFVTGMRSIIPMPLESILQTLCALNHVVNGEELTLKDIYLHDGISDIGTGMQIQGGVEYAKSVEENAMHNSYFVEEAIMHIVRTGDVPALEEYMKTIPSFRIGKLANDQIRQSKNVFIVTVTLVSRAAIRGGLDVEEALTLSDRYIKLCEDMSDAGDISSLLYTAIREYTEMVQRLHVGNVQTKLVKDVANYVRHHISETVSTDRMAKSLYLSRSRLSTKFKEQTGETLTDYILKEKVLEAKRLLRYTDKPITAISSYLGFSSQSHFSRVFKKYAGVTPKEYMEKHRRG